MTAVTRAQRVFDEAVSAYNDALDAWSRRMGSMERLDAMEAADAAALRAMSKLIEAEEDAKR